MTSAGIIQMLDQTIDWYRTLGIQQQAASEPSDVLILYDNRQTANQVIGLAFEIARSNAEILARQPKARETGGDPAAPTLSQLQDKFAALGTTVQAEIDTDQRLLATARPEQKNQLQAKISELQGELDLINARKSLLGTLSSFANQRDPNGSGGNALKAQIEAMAVTMPTAANATGAPPNAAAVTGTPAPAAGNTAAAPLSAPLTALSGASGSAAARFGIWDLAANAVRLSEKMATIDLIDTRTAALQATFSQTGIRS